MMYFVIIDREDADNEEEALLAALSVVGNLPTSTCFSVEVRDCSINDGDEDVFRWAVMIKEVENG